MTNDWPRGCLSTGQETCHDEDGRLIPCAESGQDGELRRGVLWPVPRFVPRGRTVADRLTELEWTRDANPGELPLTWTEALDRVALMNREAAFGHADWRLPNRAELRSLVDHQRARPTLPAGHPFENVLGTWYWTSTTAAGRPACAWYVDMAGGRMFYGRKTQSFLFWPVRGGGSGILPATGQERCYDETGAERPCAGTGEDGETRTGTLRPSPRFVAAEETVVDRLTGLEWSRLADVAGHPTTWVEALAAAASFGGVIGSAGGWRLPNINELESLVDVGAHEPALPRGHPFRCVRDGYWSSTTSLYEPDWAWALYLDKGGVGVGRKRGAHFHAWAVRDGRNH